MFNPGSHGHAERKAELLAMLVRNAGPVMTYRPHGVRLTQKTCSTCAFFCQLRQKLKASVDSPELIQTEPGFGYWLVVE